MTIDPTVFQRTLSSESELGKASLATKILVSRLRREVADSPNAMESAIEELSQYFRKHRFAARDYAAL